MSDLTPNTSATIICIGSNVEDKRHKIASAIESLNEICVITRQSGMYETPDHTGLGLPYDNVVIACRPGLSYDLFCEKLKTMEDALGRTPSSKSTGVMPIDIDIIYWEGQLVDPVQSNRDYFRIGYNEIERTDF